MKWFVGFETAWSRDLGSLRMSADGVCYALNGVIIISKTIKDKLKEDRLVSHS